MSRPQALHNIPKPNKNVASHSNVSTTKTPKKRRRAEEGLDDNESYKKRNLGRTHSEFISTIPINRLSIQDEGPRPGMNPASIIYDVPGGVMLNSQPIHEAELDINQNFSDEEFMQFLENEDDSGPLQSPRPENDTSQRTNGATTRGGKRGPNGSFDTSGANSNDPATILSTKWLTTKELKTLEDELGFQYKRGPFSGTEKACVESALDTFGMAHGLSREEVLNIMFTKRVSIKQEYKTFWTDIAVFVPMRPLTAIFNFCKRAYHPLQKQGKWTPEEDTLLLKAVREYGQLWEKVSERVGRMGSDCRDRYRLYLQDASQHKQGHWSKEEEDKLISIMQEMSSGQAPDEADAAFWGAVVKRMGGTRNRSQIRLKWNDSLSKVLKSDGPCRWLPIDAYILVHKLATIDITDEQDINWKLLLDDDWNVWSPHELQRRWVAMKRAIVGHEQMPFEEILDILIAKKGSIPPEDIAAALQQRQYGKSKGRKNPNHVIRSKEFISSSDDE